MYRGVNLIFPIWRYKQKDIFLIPLCDCLIKGTVDFKVLLNYSIICICWLLLCLQIVFKIFELLVVEIFLLASTAWIDSLILKSHWWLYECLCRVKGGLWNTVIPIATMSLPSVTKIKMWLYPPGDYSTITVLYMVDINIHVGIDSSTSINNIELHHW